MSLSASMEMPPLWPLDQSHLLHDYCWRCDCHTALVHDPMMDPGDPIKVCAPCAQDRRLAKIRVQNLGRDFVPVRRPEHSDR